MMNITNKANNTVLSSTLLAPAAPVSQLTFAQKKQLCIGWLSTEFQAYQRAGGQESLQAWVQSQILQALQAEKIPYTLKGSVQTQAATGSPSAASVKPSSPSSPPPPNEPGLVSEGLGPIEWAIWAWDIGSKGVEGVGKVVGEIVVDDVVDGIADWVSGWPNDPTPTTPTSGPGDGDGSMGTSPSNGSGLSDGSEGGDGGDGGGGGSPGGPSHDGDPTHQAV
jgi:hypothetical protein